jgi:hypothetical protein
MIFVSSIDVGDPDPRYQISVGTPIMVRFFDPDRVIAMHECGSGPEFQDSFA